MAGPWHVQTLRSKGQGHAVMKCAAGMGMHVDMIVQVYTDKHVFGTQIKLHLNTMPHTVTQLLSFSLSRLESDIGHSLVATSLSLLARSRVGQCILVLYTLVYIHNPFKMF